MKPVARFRNVAVHDYLDVDYDEIWNIITKDLPPLKEHVTRMLAESRPEF